MYVQCPECLTLYELDAATLAQAHGTVGCGQCGATFSALSTLAEHLPAEPFESLAVHPASPAPPILMMAARHPAIADPAGTIDAENGEGLDEAVPATDTEVPASGDNADVGTGIADDRDTKAASDPLSDFLQYMQESRPETRDAPGEEAPGTRDDDTGGVDETPAIPSFLHHRRAPAAPMHTWRWVLGCLVLTLCLGLQLAWAERQALAADPVTRPWLAKACSWLGCTLPTVRDLSDLELLSRDVRPHPSVPGALLISATVRNNATFAQPYPVVSITLSDLDENRIAMRRFRPSTYMTSADTQAAGLAPGATAALMFEVKDPGRNAIAFQFGFQ